MIGQRNEGVFAILESIIAGVGEKLGGAASALGGALASGGAEVSSSGGGMFASLKDTLFGGADKGPEIAPAATRQIEAPVVAQSKFHADIADLGNLSPPSVGMAGRSSGMGMSA